MAGEFLRRIPVIGAIFGGGNKGGQPARRERLPAVVKGDIAGDVTAGDAEIRVYRDTERQGDPLMELARYGASAQVALPDGIEGELDLRFTGLTELEDPNGYEGITIKARGLRFSGSVGASVGSLPPKKEKK